MPRKAQLPKLEPLPSPIYATWSPRAADSTERWKAYISDDNQSAYFLWVDSPAADQLPYVTELEQVNGNWYTKAETAPKTKEEIYFVELDPVNNPNAARIWHHDGTRGTVKDHYVGLRYFIEHCWIWQDQDQDQDQTKAA